MPSSEVKEHSLRAIVESSARAKESSILNMAETTSIRALVRARRGDILRLADQHGARRVRLFGSVVRGEDHDASDLDLLVEMAEDRDLLDRIGLKQDLEELLGVDVDVVTENALHPVLRDQVLTEAVEL